jgi:hypothetical protein
VIVQHAYPVVASPARALALVLLAVAGPATPASSRDLTEAEQAIVALLRGPTASIGPVGYYVTITIPGEPGTPTLTVEADCRVETGSAEATPFNVSGRLPLCSILLSGGYRYRLSPGKARVETERGDLVAELDAAGDKADLPRPLSQFPSLGPMLVSASDMLDVGAFFWEHRGAEPTGLEVYEARAQRPIRRTESPPLARIRFWYDPGLPSVTQVVAYTADGTVAAETVYDQETTMEDGKHVFLRTITKVADRVHMERVQVQKGDVREVAVPRPGRTVVTTYEWLREAHIAVPSTREVTDARGRLLCRCEYWGQRLLPPE